MRHVEISSINPPLTSPHPPPHAQPKSLVGDASNLIAFHCYQSPPPSHPPASIMASSLIKTVLYMNDHTISSIQFVLRVGFYFDLLRHLFFLF